jgi:hypothetical protein
MKIGVACYSGYRVDEKPKSIRFGSLVVQVKEVLDQWLSQDHRYFKVTGDDEATYIIRQDMASTDWELTYYKQADPGDRADRKNV